MTTYRSSTLVFLKIGMALLSILKNAIEKRSTSITDKVWIYQYWMVTFFNMWNNMSHRPYVAGHEPHTFSPNIIIIINGVSLFTGTRWPMVSFTLQRPNVWSERIFLSFSARPVRHRMGNIQQNDGIQNYSDELISSLGWHSAKRMPFWRQASSNECACDCLHDTSFKLKS